MATFALLAADADLDAVELAELRQLAKKLSGVGLREIDAALKAAQQKQAARKPGGTGAPRRPPAGPAATNPAPFQDDPWLPQMDVLNEVIGDVGRHAASARHRRRRDADAQAPDSQTRMLYRRQTEEGGDE